MNKKNIIIIIVVIAVIFFAMNYLGSSTDSGTGSLGADTSTSNSSDAKYIYALLQEMKEVKLMDTIFKDPIFQNLKDNTVVFAPQEAGRNNPFSPVGSDLGSTNTPAKTTPTTKI